ncbi:MAG: patatin-like phospholipase family protein [SAR324 cluster bacterium]|nr:patatin-like phospholipase family protein [SAR324 cluster bacterium]
MQEKRSEKPRLGIALGGGVARGIAHIGILKALEEQDLIPDFLTGTSVGAFVGGLYAFGKTPEELRDLTKKMNWLDVSRITLPKYGLLSNDEFGKVVERQISDAQIEDSPIPLAFIATDISTGERVVLKEGRVSTAIMASACIPGIFVPTTLEGRMLVDGSLVESVPVSPLREMGADLVVGVNIDGVQNYSSPAGIVDVLLNAFSIAIETSAKCQAQQADITINLGLTKYSRTNANHAWELYAEGYRSGILAGKKIQAELEKRNPSPLAIWEKKFKEWRKA